MATPQARARTTRNPIISTQTTAAPHSCPAPAPALMCRTITAARHHPITHRRTHSRTHTPTRTHITSLPRISPQLTRTRPIPHIPALAPSSTHPLPRPATTRTTTPWPLGIAHIVHTIHRHTAGAISRRITVFLRITTTTTTPATARTTTTKARCSSQVRSILTTTIRPRQ